MVTMPSRCASCGVDIVTFLPSKLMVPAFGCLRTRQDLDQGGLAGSVFAYECVDLAGSDLETDIVERAHARESHSDSRHAQ